MRERFANFVLECVRLTESYRDAQARRKAAHSHMIDQGLEIVALKRTVAELRAEMTMFMVSANTRIELLEAQPQRKAGKRG